MEQSGTSLLTKENITILLSFLGALQGFVLCGVVWFYPRAFKTSNRILSLFLFTLAILLIAPRLIEQTGVLSFGLLYGFRLLIPISLYLYVESLYRELKWKRKILYFLPIVVDFCIIVLIILIKTMSSTDNGSFLKMLLYFNYYFPLFVCLIYLKIIADAIKSYRLSVNNSFSSEHKLGIHWVAQVFIGFVVLILIDIIMTVLVLSKSKDFMIYSSLINTLTYTFFMYYITIKGKLNPEIYQLKRLNLINETIAGADDKATTYSIQETKLELEELSQKITKLLEEEKLYLSMGLTINEVADHLDSQPYLVSQAINLCLGKNFFELVNRYRVEEAKNMLTNVAYNHLSILGIGYEAGFNSKTAFNTAFKKYTGFTPSEYKKKVSTTPFL